MAPGDPSSEANDLAVRIDQLRSENERLGRSVKELESLFKIALSLGSGAGFDGVMRGLIEMTVESMSAEDGSVTLVDSAGEGAETLVRAHASTLESPLRITNWLLGWMIVNQSPLLTNNPQESRELRNYKLDERIRSLVCVPMQADGELIGTLAVFNKQSPSGFSPDDVRFLSIIASLSAPRLEAARLASEKDAILRIFGPHISPDVADLLLSRHGDVPSERREVCTMFLDVRGYSAFSEKRSPEEVVAYLNELFSFTLDIVAAHHGIVHQLLGDGFMAVFGAPFSFNNDSQNAVDAAMAILKEVGRRNEAGTISPTRLSIGLHTGTVVAGIVGGADRREYKVTGDAVNVAARVEQATREFDADMLITDAVLERIDRAGLKTSTLGEIALRGRKAKVPLYRVDVE